MKFLYISLILSMALSASVLTNCKTTYTPEIVPKKMSVKTKKERFFCLVAPAVERVHKKLMKRYLSVEEDLKLKQNRVKTDRLKVLFKAQTDKELLEALKPHPPSIVLAQAAMESAWATSRFFTQANNIFGMWSSNPNEPRIAAGVKRGGTRTIWLRKFTTIDESVEEYYKLMARGKAFKEFRQVRYESDDVFKIILKLDKYSEIGDKYAKALGSMIRYNKLTKYD